jgi:hypothetical protein
VKEEKKEEDHHPEAMTDSSTSSQTSTPGPSDLSNQHNDLVPVSIKPSVLLVDDKQGDRKIAQCFEK